MNATTGPATSRVRRSVDLPGYVRHPSFESPEGAREYATHPVVPEAVDYAVGHMPDDETRAHARSMHYAAYRAHRATTPAARHRWQARYFALRDRIVLGNRKLIYRAVRRQMAISNLADDAIGECQIVLIHAVATFNPWLDVRFSTYAYTCLIRALSRQVQRHAKDRLSRAISLNAVPESEPQIGDMAPPLASTGSIPVEVFLRHDHPLLTDREKAILTHRFLHTGGAAERTLEAVGGKLGLSKERVRQLQMTALLKLRQAITGAG
jgi:RNA polymerase sigma factor (sigma-70 family)